MKAKRPLTLSKLLREAGVAKDLQARARDLERQVGKAELTMGEWDRLAFAIEEECVRQRELVRLIREYLARQGK